jgi:hypothetical protein
MYNVNYVLGNGPFPNCFTLKNLDYFSISNYCDLVFQPVYLLSSDRQTYNPSRYPRIIHRITGSDIKVDLESSDLGKFELLKKFMIKFEMI